MQCERKGVFLDFFSLKTVLILGAGVAAGFINVLAGGGSLITMPVLIFLGLPAATANGTNRIAILSQNIFAVSNFKKKGYFYWKTGLLLAIPAVIGSIIGSSIAVDISGELFEKILSIVMLAVLGLILFSNIKKKANMMKNEKPQNIPYLIIGFFFVGLYGGFIQGGVGFIIIAVLSIIGQITLLKTNTIKVLIIGIYMIPSLIIFYINGNLNFVYGLLLAVGNSAGAWMGSNFAVNKGDKWIRIILAVAIVAMSVKLFFF